MTKNIRALAVGLLSATPLTFSGGYVFGILSCFFIGVILLTINSEITKSVISDVPLPVFFMALYGFGNAVIQNINGEPLRHFEFLLPFVLAPVIYIGSKYIADSERSEIYFFVGVSTSVIIASAWAVFQAILSDPPQRVDGPTSGKIIAFGNLSALLGILSLCGILASRKVRAYASLSSIAIAGLIAGVLASALNGSKSAWVSMAILLPFVVAAVISHLTPLVRTSMFLGFAAMVSISWLHPDSVVQDRTYQAWIAAKDILQFGYSEDGSLGARLAMWRWGLQEGFFASPLTGTSREQMIAMQQIAVSGKSIPGLTSTWNHLHNEYIHTLVTRGLIGLGLLGMMFLSIGLYFLRRTVQASSRGIAITGLVALAMFALFSLWDIQFLVNAIRSQFIYLTLILIAFTEARTKKENIDY